MHHRDPDDRSPATAELLDDAYGTAVGVETAARHLWAIHKAAAEGAGAADGAAAAGASSPERPRELVGASAQPAPTGRRVPRAAVPLLVVMMVMSSSGVALAASRSSLPGDVLYAVKRGTETAQLIFTRNPEARVQLQLAFARTRLDEIRLIGDTRPQLIPGLVSAIAVSLAEVEEVAPEIAPATARLREETTAQIASMDLPGEITQAVGEVIAAQPTATPTSTASVPTATAEPTDDVDPVAAAEPVATEQPTAGAVTATPVPSPTTASPTPTASGSPTPTGTPTEGGGAVVLGDGAAPVDGLPPTGSGPGGGGSEDAGSESPAPDPGPSGEGGASRTEDGPEGGSPDGATTSDDATTSDGGSGDGAATAEPDASGGGVYQRAD